MTWRGSATPADRIFAALPYLLPLIEGLIFGQFLFAQFPQLALIFLPVFPLLQLYASIPLAGLIIFFALFFLVVRNENISHFIRFNTMQAILIDILLSITRLIVQLSGSALSSGFLAETLFNVIFLGVFAACAYSIVQSLLGRYAEIPTLSEAVHMQVR